jgi:riboflavin kinase/FMN adenylyltransferase
MTRGHDLKKLGIEVVSCLNFTLDVGALEPETFIREVLLSHLGARAVVVGPGFRFGAERRGGLDSFVARDDRRAIEVFVEEPVEDDAGPVSSTRVRAALALADLDRAARLLGRRYAIRGPIVRGDARGRTLGYPTANVELSGVNALARGVYAGWAVLEDAAAARRRVAAAINLGLRPTVAGEDLRCEAHLLDFAGDLYGQTLRLEPLVHLRPERRFASVDDLRAAIGRDVEATRAIVSAS